MYCFSAQAAQCRPLYSYSTSKRSINDYLYDGDRQNPKAVLSYVMLKMKMKSVQLTGVHAHFVWRKQGADVTPIHNGKLHNP